MESVSANSSTPCHGVVPMVWRMLVEDCFRGARSNVPDPFDDQPCGVSSRSPAWS